MTEKFKSEMEGFIEILFDDRKIQERLIDEISVDTEKDGRERGVSVCLGPGGKPHIHRVCVGDECSVEVTPCDEFAVGASIHTHAIEKNEIEETIEETMNTMTRPSAEDIVATLMNNEPFSCITGVFTKDSGYKGRQTRCWFPRHTFRSGFSRTAVYQAYGELREDVDEDRISSDEFDVFMDDLRSQLEQELTDIFHTVIIGELSEEIVERQ